MPGRRVICVSDGVRHASPSRDIRTLVVVCTRALSLSPSLFLSLSFSRGTREPRDGVRRKDKWTVSQSVSQVDRGRGDGSGSRWQVSRRGHFSTPHDAATVRARSIRHSKQSARYVHSSQDASDNGRSRRHRRAATTTISAALRQPTDEPASQPASQPTSQPTDRPTDRPDGRTDQRTHACTRKTRCPAHVKAVRCRFETLRETT